MKQDKKLQASQALSQRKKAVKDELERKHDAWLSKHHAELSKMGFLRGGQPPPPGSCLALIALVDPARAAHYTAQTSPPQHHEVLQVLLEVLDAAAALVAGDVAEAEL